MLLNGQQTLEELDRRHSHLASVCSHAKDLEEKLRRIYLSGVGVEFDHVSCVAEQSWLYNEF